MDIDTQELFNIFNEQKTFIQIKTCLICENFQTATNRFGDETFTNCNTGPRCRKDIFDIDNYPDDRIECHEQARKCNCFELQEIFS